jgi:trehalose-6-phosphate synthase
MKPNIYKIHYRYSEKKFKDFYTEASSEELAIQSFKAFRPQAREFTIEQVDRNEPTVGRLLALSRFVERMKHAQKELDDMQILPSNPERILAIRYLKKVITQCNIHINGTHRNLQKLKQHHAKTNS